MSRRFRFQFRRYRLPFRASVRTSHGLWAEREGIIVRLQDASGGTAFGEAAPIPWFGTESVGEIEAGCRGLGEWVESAAFDALPARLRCLRNALASALAEIERAEALAREGARPVPKTAPLGVAALLPAGVAALPLIAPRAEVGFRVFKWKVGVGDVVDELALFDDLCAALPSGAKVRLDANGAWDRRKAERWLERCAERPVEFVEQPCFVDAVAGKTAQRRNDDVLLGLAQDYPTPIALDESIVSDDEVEQWIGAGWPGVFVVKPSLLGDVAGCLAALERARASVVFSSALETAVGAKSALRTAFAWAGTPAPEAGGVAAAQTQGPESRARALGFGVWPLFADSRFDGPVAGPYLRLEDVERLNPEAIWNALS